MSHVPHLHHDAAALTRRILVWILVLVVIGAAVGTLLGVSLAKGFDFLDLSSFGSKYKGG